MGWNTTIVVMNDALNEIERDPEFGRKLKHAVGGLFVRSGPIGVPAGGIASAAQAIETHQSDMTSLLAVGGNGAARLHMSLGWKQCDPEEQLRLLLEWADSAGYRLVKKSAAPAREEAVTDPVV